jgi:hypothetical protein
MTKMFLFTHTPSALAGEAAVYALPDRYSEHNSHISVDSSRETAIAGTLPRLDAASRNLLTASPAAVAAYPYGAGGLLCLSLD